MTKTVYRQRLAKRALIATATLLAVAACSTSTPGGKPAPSSSAAAAGQAAGCKVNPSSAPVPIGEKYEPVPEVGRISVALSGIASGEVKPGDPPTDVDVAVCNDSPVGYPQVGVVLVLQHCSCATYPSGMPRGTVERFDQTTGGWAKVDYPVEGTGMDYIGTYSNVQELPKGKSVTLRYRVALDASMTAGKGGVEAVVVTPNSLMQIGKADLPFTVVKGPNDRSNGPSSEPEPPAARQTPLPFTGLTYPMDMAVDVAGDVYVTDSWSNRVLKLAAGSNEQAVLPFTGLNKPGGVAVNGAGDVFVADGANNRVLKLAAGSKDQTALPFTGLDNPQHVAVDTGGNVYVTDGQVRMVKSPNGSYVKAGKLRVVKLAAGSNEQTVLPFTGLESPGGLAVDGAGNVFVSEAHNYRMLELSAGSGNQTVRSLGGLEGPFVVNSAGDLYFTDAGNKNVLKLPAGSNDSTALPFKGLNGPRAVAVDGAGNVYVLDNSGFGQIVKLVLG
jgi:serine/threonine protein kinase, bacterial